MFPPARPSGRRLELDVAAIRQRAREGAELRRQQPQAVHPRIDFQVKSQAGFYTRRFRRALETAHVFQARHGRRQTIRDEPLLFPWPESRENQNGLANTGFAKFDSLVGAGDAKAFRAGFLQRLRHRHSAQSVGIRFDDRKYLWLWPDVAPNRAQIPRNRMERNLRPDRPSQHSYCFRHVHLGCQTLPRSGDANRNP